MKKEFNKHIRSYKDYLKKGVTFWDITPVLVNRKLFNWVIDEMTNCFLGAKIDAVVCPEARGFVFGGAVASKLGCGVLVVRKEGKLPPCPKKIITYSKEYGEGRLEIPTGLLKPKARVVIVDDVLATGGTAYAIEQALLEMGYNVIGSVFVIGLLKPYEASKYTLNSTIHAVINYEE